MNGHAMIQDPLFLVAVNLFAAFLMRSIKPNLFSALILGVVMIASTTYLGTQHTAEIMFAIYRGRDYVQATMGQSIAWPPEAQEKYPDLLLRDQDGRLTRLSEFKGKVILLEPVGMSCPGCIAFSGGERCGPFLNSPPQPDLQSIEEYARQYGDVELDHPDIVFVQVLFFNQNMQAPTAEEVAAWAEHFGFLRSRNQIVLRGTEQLATVASQSRIPGFHLIDKNFVLRSDSTGDQPDDDLYQHLLPLLRELVEDSEKMSQPF